MYFIIEGSHCDIYSNKYRKCDYYSDVVQQKLPIYFGKSAIEQYIPLSSQITVNNDIFCGEIIGHRIGYIYIGSFDGCEEDYNFITKFLIKYKNAKGIIFDIRHNGGGNENYAKIIANHLTNRTVTYRYRRFRNGSNYSDLSGFEPQVLTPVNKEVFTKMIMLLTDKYTFSAAEDFTLMLRSLPNVIQVGDTTFGGVGTNPQYKTLSNGWRYKNINGYEL